jgi:hypothetical protein
MLVSERDYLRRNLDRRFRAKGLKYPQRHKPCIPKPKAGIEFL